MEGRQMKLLYKPEPRAGVTYIDLDEIKPREVELIAWQQVTHIDGYGERLVDGAYFKDSDGNLGAAPLWELKTIPEDQS